MKLDYFNNKENSLLKNIEFRANYLLKYNYKKYIHVNYNIALIENIMSNGRCHAVAVFKDYLINDDIYEYLRRFYKNFEIKPRLKKLFYYHFETSAIFPNYFPLTESKKYLYRSVVKKQRIINEQQDLEDKKYKIKSKNEDNDKLFTSTIYDEILDGSESVMRIVFGLDKNKYNLKEYANIKDNKDDSPYLNKDSFELNTLINEIDKAENNITPNNKNKNNKNIIEYNLNAKNKNSKPKLKLVSKELNDNDNNKIKSKNDLLNSITNNSTNITNSSNNIKANINLTIKPTINDNKDSLFTENKKLKLNKNIINIIKNNREKIKNIYFNNDLKILENKKIAPIPYRTLFGLNFILKNQLINNLIKNDSNIKNHNKDNLNTKKFNYYLKNKKTSNSIKNFNLIAKEKKIPKIDISKLDTNNINNILTTSNRTKSRNFNEIFKGISKSYLKYNKNSIKNIINPTLTLSPLNKRQKNFFRKESNMKFLYTNNSNSKSIKAISCKKNNENYLSNKKLRINEYIFKKNNYLNVNLNEKENKEYITNKKLKNSIKC